VVGRPEPVAIGHERSSRRRKLERTHDATAIVRMNGHSGGSVPTRELPVRPGGVGIVGHLPPLAYLRRDSGLTSRRNLGTHEASDPSMLEIQSRTRFYKSPGTRPLERAIVVEKQVISDEATVGIYNFRHGSDFVRAADQMIAKNLRVNNEFYVAPTYNQLISEGARVAIFNVGSEGAGMYGLGIPSDLTQFLAMPVSLKSVA
jgi:hypothetical protein